IFASFWNAFCDSGFSGSAMPRISAIRRSALRSEKKLIESSRYPSLVRARSCAGRPPLRVRDPLLRATQNWRFVRLQLYVVDYATGRRVAKNRRILKGQRNADRAQSATIRGFLFRFDAAFLDQHEHRSRIRYTAFHRELC